MLDYTKHQDFFDPLESIKLPIHVIGCGAIGSTITEMLLRMGVQKIHLWDFDKVAPHNIANQMFFQSMIGMPKTDALEVLAHDINPACEIIKHEKYTNEPLNGYIFLAVDSIEVRKAIIEANQYNPYTHAFFDFRMRLTDAQHYAAVNTPDGVKALLATMNFTSEEAKVATPINACGTTLNIVNTVRMIVSAGLSNFINFVKESKLRPMILIDAFSFLMD